MISPHRRADGLSWEPWGRAQPAVLMCFNSGIFFESHGLEKKSAKEVIHFSVTMDLIQTSHANSKSLWRQGHEKSPWEFNYLVFP